MYVPAPETYWLGQKVKGQGHSRHEGWWQLVEFYLHCEPKKHQNVLSYIPQNPVDSDKNLVYIVLNKFAI